MSKKQSKIGIWFREVYEVLRKEIIVVTRDMGVILFFVILPLAYPLLYTAIYDPEVVRDMNVVVVDNSRSHDSRLLVRELKATENIHIIGYANDMAQARHLLAMKECYGIVEIPEDFARSIGRHEKAVVQFYSDTSLLIRFRGFLSSLSDVTMNMGAELRQRVIDSAGEAAASMGGGMPVESKSVFLGNPQQGFASFAIQAILIFVVQQSLILGVCMLAGGSRERRRRNNGYDPMEVKASASATIIGRSLCYSIFYVPVIVYIFQFVPTMFSLPHADNLVQFVTFMLPMIFASSFLGMVVQAFVKERETSLLVVVFTSVIFLFLSGITWPRYAMSWLWRAIGDIIPGVWAVEGFVKMNALGADISMVVKPYVMMWLLTIFYFIAALLIQRRQMVRNREGDKR